MKIKFEELQYQEDAIKSAVDLFEGAAVESGIFTIVNPGQQVLADYSKGVSNRMTLSKETIRKNLNKVQLRNGIKQNKVLEDLDFTFDMETGTGKTYVYLRTIMELNEKYGLTKFIIVVPSIAIKEGVLKSLEMTREDFAARYQNKPYNYFEYNSDNLGEISEFATSNQAQIMVINIQAFNRIFTENALATNTIHRPQEQLNGNKPIDLIADTNPVVIVDEPQSVMGGKRSKQAIRSLNPLMLFRYSATHKERTNCIYELNAIDAYELELVKQIEVSSAKETGAHNDAYIKLLSVDNTESPITAKVEIDVAGKDSIQRKTVTVRSNDDLYQLSGMRDVYTGYIIDEIYTKEGSEYIDFTSKPGYISLGQSIGGIDSDYIKRGQIQATIETHLDKALDLKKRGIKVLSLFFIDKVANYRIYEEDGTRSNGKYANWFEEDCFELIRKPKYRDLFPSWVEDAGYSDEAIKEYVRSLHGGYFSQDRKGKAQDTSGKTQADEDTYELIMKDKESLLSFDTDLAFIFSHSALKEGWDNPNVFQICTLNETKSESKKRQEIGRGLRIAVNQRGERVYGFDVNTLTIMANESYEDYARGLQTEYEKDAGYKFGIIEDHNFANLIIEEDGQADYLGEERSKELYDDLLDKGYIDKKGKVLYQAKSDIEEGIFVLDSDFNPIKDQVALILTRAYKEKIKVMPADNKKKVKANKEVVCSEEFKELWNKIKYKTRYSVDIDTPALIKQCIKDLDANIRVARPTIEWEKADLVYDQGGIVGELVEKKTKTYEFEYKELPDILSALCNSTGLTRTTIARILDGMERFDLFKTNPQQFIDQASSIINRVKESMLVDGIKYTTIAGKEFSIQELYLENELIGYLNENLIKADKATHEYVVYDSNIEKSFVESFELNQAVKVYSKLPPEFKIDTPLGTYNPDWAIVMEDEGETRLYLVVESKSTMNQLQLRMTENYKIRCGQEHFKALNTGVQLQVYDDADKIIRENIGYYDA